MDFVIRKMTAEDVEQAIAIDRASFSLPWPPRSFYFEVNDNPAARCWAAESQGKIIGMVVAWFIVDEIHIATIATHPDFRRQKVGEALLAHTLRRAKEEGALTSFLEVRESNEAALRMYRKFGYMETGRREKYYADNGETAILMTLKMDEK